jgi:2-polyprenyl-6-methoxyphenol hydroxylase-like FAD-dependent oxidoreductase
MYQIFYRPSRGEGTASVPPAPTSAVILAGDAVHAFPPDLGQGVNSALEDVYALHRALERNNDSLEAGENVLCCLYKLGER